MNRPSDQASLKEILLYAIGDVGEVATRISDTLKQVLIVSLGFNPLLMGFAFAVQSIWLWIVDLFVAYISDRTRSPRGRRIPFILVGGIGSMAVLVLLVFFIPHGNELKTNAEMKENPRMEQSEETVEENMTEKTMIMPTSVTGNHKYQTVFKRLSQGFYSLKSSENAMERRLFFYLLIGLLVFGTFSSIHRVPYQTLSVELSPSYDGRSRVAIFKTLVPMPLALVLVWIPHFCFLSRFKHAFHGLRISVLVIAASGVLLTIWFCRNVRERTFVTSTRRKTNFIQHVCGVMRNGSLWRVFVCALIIIVVNGAFIQFAFYLNIYWVCTNLQFGLNLIANFHIIVWALSFACLPLFYWACRRFQKHQVLAVTIILMSLGSLLSWWTITPVNPYLQFVHILFLTPGCFAFYFVLKTMISDVTDDDALHCGERRDAMVLTIISHLRGIGGMLVSVLAVTLLMISGFDVTLEYNQAPRTILTMRILCSFVPAVFFLLALIPLWKYPLTREKVTKIQRELEKGV